LLLPCDARTGGDLVLEVELELPFGREVLDERRDVARVELARVVRHRAREVRRAEDRDAVVRDFLVGPRQVRVTTLLGREVDDHRAGAHRLDRRLRDQFRGGPARDERGRDDDVEVADPRLELLLLAALLLVGELARVAAFGFLADDTELEEGRAEALDLLLDDGPDVEAGDDGSEAARGRN